MNDFIVVLAPAAEHDIAETFLWYRERNILAADGFRTEVFDAIEPAHQSPASCRALHASGSGPIDGELLSSESIVEVRDAKSLISPPGFLCSWFDALCGKKVDTSATKTELRGAVE